MADFSIGGELDINISKALSAVGNVGRRIDETLLKIGKPITVDFDTKPAEKDLADLKVKAEEVGNSLSVDKSGKLAGGSSIIDGIGGSLAGLVSPIGLATAGLAAMGAGLTYAFTVGQEFEQGMAGLGAITGLSGEALNDIGTRAQDLAVKFGGSVTTQIESFQGILSKFGADLAKTPDDLGKVSESVNLLAKAGGIDAATAMNTLTGAMLQFGVDTGNSSELAAESARFINVMAASARVGAAEIPQVGEAITVAGVAMKGAKVSFEEGNAAIQVLAAGGKTGAEAGTALRNVLGKIAGEEVIPKEALAKLKSLGVDMKLVSNTALPLETRLKELKKASGDATAFAQVFGSENAAAASILANGSETVKKWTADITGTSDATTQAAINMDTLSERINRGKAAFEAFSINIFKVLSPVLSSVIGTITDAFGKVTDALAPIFSKLGETFGALFTRIKPIFAAIAGFIGGVWITQITTYFAVVGTAVNVVLTVFNKLFDGIVSAVSPVIDALKKAFGFSDDATKSIDILEIFGNILSTITDTISFFGDILIEIGGFLVEFLIAPLKIGFTVVAAIIEPIVNFGKSLFSAGETTKGLGDFFSTLIGYIKEAPGFIKAVTAGFSAFTSGITDLISNFSFDKLKALLSGKTFSDAMMGEMNEQQLEKNQATTLGQFQDSVKRLADQRTKANIEKNAAQKKAYQDEFDAEKVSLINRINEKEKAGALEKEAAQKLRVSVMDLNLAAAKADEDAKAKVADKAAKDGKDKKINSLKDEIAKANEETRKLTAEGETTLIKDELERAVKANEDKILAAQKAVQKEIADTKALKDVAENERLQLLAALELKENAILTNGLNARDEIIRKFHEKQNEDAQKALDKRNDEVDKINAKLDEDERKRADDLQAYRTKLDEDYAASHKSVFERIADETTSILASISDAIASAFTVDDSAQKEATATAKKEYETQEKDLLASLKKRVISFDDYQSQIAAAQGKLNEAGASAGRSFGDAFTDGLNKAIGGISATFEKISNGMIGQYSKDAAELGNITKDLKKERDELEKNAATDSVEKVKQRKERIEKLEIDQGKLQMTTAEKTSTAIVAVTLAATAGLTQALAEGTNVWTGLVLGTLDALNALIPMFTALILGKELTELGPLGLISAAGLIAVMSTAVAVAKSAVKENGFFGGGDTREYGKHEVAGVVHGKEFIVSADGVKGEYDAFHKLHKILKSGESMGNILTAYERPELSNTFVGSGGLVVNQIIPRTANDNSAAVISELRAQTYELSRKLDNITAATEAMPTAFRGNVKHDFNITHDPSLSIKRQQYADKRKALQ